MTTVLCVEDEERLRHDIVAELKYAGYNVLQACDGQEGLAAIIQHKPDLVVSDITMPNMNGHELLTKVRSDYPKFAEMPFIFLSALADRKDVLDGVKLGADEYLTKPIDYELFLAKVDAALQRSDRITKKKEEEHIKLYNALSQTNPSDKDKRTWPSMPSRKIILVGRSDQGMWPIQQFLEELGHQTWIVTSGRSYLDKVEAGSVNADLTLLWFQSDDMQAHMILRMSAEKSGKYILVVPENLYSPSMNMASKGFDDAIGLPLDEETLYEKMKAWVQ